MSQTLQEIIREKFPKNTFEEGVVSYSNLPTIATNHGVLIDMYRESDQQELLKAVEKQGNAKSRYTFGEYIVMYDKEKVDERSAVYGLSYLCCDPYIPVVYGKLSEVEPEYLVERVNEMSVGEADQLTAFIEKYGIDRQKEAVKEVIEKKFEADIEMYERC